MIFKASPSELTIYLDMDETLVDFSGELGLQNALRNMRQRDFYRNLYPNPGAWAIVNWLRDNGFGLKVISGVIDSPFVCDEKLWWCENYLNVSRDDVILVPKEERKVDYVDGVTEYDVLVDDYDRYVNEWKEAGGSAFLFNPGGKWSMGCVQSFSELRHNLMFLTEDASDVVQMTRERGRDGKIVYSGHQSIRGRYPISEVRCGPADSVSGYLG